MGTFFSEHSMGPASYAGAMAAVLLAGIVTIGMVVPGGTHSRPGTGGTTLVANKAVSPGSEPITERLLTLQASHSGAPRISGPSIQSARPVTPLQGQPRYIIDARPASYEPSFAF
jgi:hypothetical protein